MATENKYFISTGTILAPTSKLDILMKDWVGCSDSIGIWTETINPLEAKSFDTPQEAESFLKTNLDRLDGPDEDAFEIIVISFIR